MGLSSIVVIILIICGCTYYINFYRAETQESDIETCQCYLCFKDINKREWENHRKLCAITNAALLNHLPKADILCPKCSKNMRVLPFCDISFQCGSENCIRHSLVIYNTFGNNRYNCFLCDFNLCGHCFSSMRRNRPLNQLSVSVHIGNETPQIPNYNNAIYGNTAFAFASAPMDNDDTSDPPTYRENDSQLPNYDNAVNVNRDLVVSIPMENDNTREYDPNLPTHVYANVENNNFGDDLSDLPTYRETNFEFPILGFRKK